MGPLSPMKILLVEDDPHLAASLQQGFREHDCLVRHVATLSAARRELADEVPDLVVLDLGLPDGDGLALLSLLRQSEPALPVIVTTARGELEQRLRGLDLGADDYLVKPYAFAELLARVRALHRRSQPRPTGRLRLGDLEVDPLARRVTRAQQILDLTPREYDVLVRLLRAQGAVVTREMLAREVWRQHAWTPSLDNAMDVHISRLRDKLDRHQARPLLHTVRGVGYRLREEP